MRRVWNEANVGSPLASEIHAIILRKWLKRERLTLPDLLLTLDRATQRKGKYAATRCLNNMIKANSSEQRQLVRASDGRLIPTRNMVDVFFQNAEIRKRLGRESNVNHLNDAFKNYFLKRGRVKSHDDLDIELARGPDDNPILWLVVKRSRMRLIRLEGLAELLEKNERDEKALLITVAS